MNAHELGLLGEEAGLHPRCRSRAGQAQHAAAGDGKSDHGKVLVLVSVAFGAGQQPDPFRLGKFTLDLQVSLNYDRPSMDCECRIQSFTHHHLMFSV